MQRDTSIRLSSQQDRSLLISSQQDLLEEDSIFVPDMEQSEAEDEEQVYTSDHFSPDVPPIEDVFNIVFDSTLEENIQFAQDFESKLSSLNIGHCDFCSQISLTPTGPVCGNCLKFSNPDSVDPNDPYSKINPFCRLNNMDPGIVPEQLTGLSFIEQLLISRVKVCLTVFKLRGGQYGYHGQVINFNQDVTELATLLPHSLTSLSNVLIVRRQTEDVTSFSEFRVRKNKVWNALRFLLDNHSGYKNIVSIDSANLDTLPEDGSVIDQLTQLPVSEESDEAVVNTG